MKNTLFILIFFLSIASTTYAASSFSHPVIQKVHEQIVRNIDQKTSKVILDTSTKIALTQKKEQLAEVLHTLDDAIQKRDKQTVTAQVPLFRKKYQETLSFIQTLESKDTLPEESKNTENTGVTSDITYYAPIFEWRHTANGDRFSQSYYSAARCQIPLGTLLQVENENNFVIVKANDRPNCSKHPDVTDLSATAFGTIGKLSTGRLQGTISILWTVPKDYIKKYVPVDIFTDLGISLDPNLPNTYLKNETLHITGKELLGKENTLLYLKAPSWKGITLGTTKGWDNSFVYDYPLEEVGTYQMVMASGLSFNTSIFASITVLDDALFSAKRRIVSEVLPEQLQELSVERRELPDLTAEYIFHLPSSDFHTITMKNDREIFTYRGFETIAIKSDALKSLGDSTPVSIDITAEKSSTPFSHDTYTHPVTVFHRTVILTPGYREEKNENITIAEESGNLIIHGIISKGKRVLNEVMLTTPDGSVTKYTFDASNIDTDGFLKRDKVFEKVIPLGERGLYLVELNYDSGFAAYNGPIILGDFLAILPNDSDNTQEEIGATDSLIVAGESLKAVNAIRAKSGKNALSLDTTLGNLATIKANDMAKNNNLSHTDSHGDKIVGTAKRNSIKIAGSVGENIAGGNISFRELLIGLANSGWHRANMLDNWKKLGIGYAVKDGQVYYVQVFGE